MVVESDLRKRVSKCEMWLVTSGLAECVCLSLSKTGRVHKVVLIWRLCVYIVACSCDF